MGTNYYWAPMPGKRSLIKMIAPSKIGSLWAGRVPEAYLSEQIHIGKSSGGWCFALHIYPDGIYDRDGEIYHPDIIVNTLQNWIEWWQFGYIENEYHEVISPSDMLRIITTRGNRHRHLSPGWCAQNQAIPGPNNLARHQIDGVHCVGHGEGTYDYLLGHFS